MKGNFDLIIQDSRPVVVDFHAVWCGPCKAQSPIMKELAAEFGDQVRILKIDVDQNSEIANRFLIRNVPTVMVFKNGQIIHKQAGVHTRQQLAEILRKNL